MTVFAQYFNETCRARLFRCKSGKTYYFGRKWRRRPSHEKLSRGAENGWRNVMVEVRGAAGRRVTGVGREK